MIVSGQANGVVTIKLHHGQLRAIQLLLAGKTIEEIVARMNHVMGYEYITPHDVIVMARDFAFHSQGVVGSIEMISDYRTDAEPTVH